MSGLSFIKSTKGRVILATAVALHIVIYVAKPAIFKGNSDSKTQAIAVPPKFLPEK